MKETKQVCRQLQWNQIYSNVDIRLRSPSTACVFSGNLGSMEASFASSFWVSFNIFTSFAAVCLLLVVFSGWSRWRSNWLEWQALYQAFAPTMLCFSLPAPLRLQRPSGKLDLGCSASFCPLVTKLWKGVGDQGGQVHSPRFVFIFDR